MGDARAGSPPGSDILSELGAKLVPRVARAERNYPYTDRRIVAAGVLCLLGIAGVHLLDVRQMADESVYLGVLFALLVGACLGLGVLLAKRWRLELVWPAAGGLALLAIVAYIYSRAIGLPQLDSHVGHWRDSVGTASIVLEALLVTLSLPALRAWSVRFAPAATFIATGLVAGALITGQATAGHNGHGGSGEHGGGHGGMNMDTATLGEKAEGRRHLGRALATAARRFPTLDAARASGYEFLPKSFDRQEDLDFWHLTNAAYQADRDYLNPDKPESLMYWNNPDGSPILVAFIYRVPRRTPNPTVAGPLFQWHAHRNSKGSLGRRKMAHLWLLDGLRNGFASSPPFEKLARRYGVPEDGGTGAGL